MKLLKYLSPEIRDPLILIINQSMLTGIFPGKLKIAKVIPLFKKDDRLNMNNYRPISILPAISKIFERVVYNQLYEYFSSNKLFYEGQYGFRGYHSKHWAYWQNNICSWWKKVATDNFYGPIQGFRYLKSRNPLKETSLLWNNRYCIKLVP